VMNLLRVVKPFKFRVYFLVMCGFPGEDDSTVRDSVDFIQTVQKEYYVRVISIGKLELFPGTEVYDIAKRKGFINDDYWLTDKRVPYYTAEHSLDKLIGYEDYILDRVGTRRIFTPKGLALNFLRKPFSIMKHFIAHKEALPYTIGWSIKLTSPRFYSFLVKVLKPARYRTDNDE